MKMTKGVMALVAALTLLPTLVTAEPEKKAEPAAEAGPTPAQLKARKLKKLTGYTKIEQTVKVAEAANQPIMAFVFIEQNPVSDFLEKKVFSNRTFRNELAKQNVVLMKLKLKLDAKSKGDKKIDLKGMKEPERKFIENFGLDERRAAQLKRQNKEIDAMHAMNYPAIIGLSPDGLKQLFRMGSYDRDGGMGVWISTVVDTLRSAGFEPEITPVIQKILDDPMAFGKKR
jgi:hypothetical protein